LADFAMESEWAALNFVIVTSSVIGGKKRWIEKQPDETLMNKGFQRTIKKEKQNKFH